jgi:hypothetical protein
VLIPCPPRQLGAEEFRLKIAYAGEFGKMKAVQRIRMPERRDAISVTNGEMCVEAGMSSYRGVGRLIEKGASGETARAVRAGHVALNEADTTSFKLDGSLQVIMTDAAKRQKAEAEASDAALVKHTLLGDAARELAKKSPFKGSSPTTPTLKDAASVGWEGTSIVTRHTIPNMPANTRKFILGSGNGGGSSSSITGGGSEEGSSDGGGGGGGGGGGEEDGDSKNGGTPVMSRDNSRSTMRPSSGGNGNGGPSPGSLRRSSGTAASSSTATSPSASRPTSPGHGGNSSSSSGHGGTGPPPSTERKSGSRRNSAEEPEGLRCVTKRSLTIDGKMVVETFVGRARFARTFVPMDEDGDPIIKPKPPQPGRFLPGKKPKGVSFMSRLAAEARGKQETAGNAPDGHVH